MTFIFCSSFNLAITNFANNLFLNAHLDHHENVDSAGAKHHNVPQAAHSHTHKHSDNDEEHTHKHLNVFTISEALVIDSHEFKILISEVSQNKIFNKNILDVQSFSPESFRPPISS